MNTLTLIGNLTHDAKFTDGSTERAFFTIAVDRRGSEGGTDYIGITCFGATAQAVHDHIGKGHLVAIQGRLRSNRYEQDDKTVHSLDVIAGRVEFLKAPNAAVNNGSSEATHDDRVEPF